MSAVNKPVLMTIIIILLLVEILFLFTLLKNRLLVSGRGRIPLIAISLMHTSALLFVILRIITYRGEFGINSNLAWYMTATLLIALGTVPKIILTLFSNSAWLLRRSYRSLSVVVNRTGKIMVNIVIALVVSGTLFGRFNFRTESISVKIDGLPADLKGLRIVQVSDLHLNSFHRHDRKLKRAMSRISDLNPDILVNTGDYVSYGYREMEPFTDILGIPEARYGNFAILGNHDMGTYYPGWNQADRDENVSRISEMISRSGYELLVDENRELRIGNASISVVGITTSGSIPDITYGDFDKATEGSSSADLRIFLSHDPNFWVYNQEMVKDMELTLSGHTHGMQMGFVSRRIRFSPAKLIFPAWNGLYGDNNMYLYVNRGLGTLGFPFRIGMPPEITVITLE